MRVCTAPGIRVPATHLGPDFLGTAAVPDIIIIGLAPISHDIVANVQRERVWWL